MKKLSKYGMGVQNNINRIVNALLSNMDYFNTFKFYAFQMDEKEFRYRLFDWVTKYDSIDYIGVDSNLFRYALQSKNPEDSLINLKS